MLIFFRALARHIAAPSGGGGGGAIELLADLSDATANEAWVFW